MKRFPFLPLLVVLVLVLDQLTKAWISSQLSIGEYLYPVPELAGVLAITHVRNTGVAFGLLPELGTLFTLVVPVVMVLVVRYLRRVPEDRRLMRLALTLVLAGAGGNLIDRLRQGYVVDFVAVGDFARFNVADSAVSIGVALLAVATWLEGRREQQAARARLDDSPDRPGV